MHKLCLSLTFEDGPIVVIATVVLHSTRGTAGPDLWFRRSVDRPVARGYVRGKRPERLSRPNPSRGQCDDTSFNAVADFGL